MAAFDWPQFLARHGIPYRTSGRNVARGHIAVKCPWCGNADPSEHMGISLNGEGWGCLRDAAHRGGSKAKLIQALINCDWPTAQRIAGDARSGILEDSFAGQLDKLFGAAPIEARKPLVLPPEFKPFGKHKPSERPFRDYLLRERVGITPYTIDHHLTSQYDMGYCTRGEQAGRIVFPVYCDRKLVAWTGRTIFNHPIRYKAIPKEIAVISHWLLWYDDMVDLADAGCNTLVLCEGPFDALNINLHGRRDGICATCCFTSAPTQPQIDFLYDLSSRFRRRILLLDRNTELMAMRVLAGVRGLGFKTMAVPAGRKDPGEMNRNEVLALAS